MIPGLCQTRRANVEFRHAAASRTSSLDGKWLASSRPTCPARLRRWRALSISSRGHVESWTARGSPDPNCGCTRRGRASPSTAVERILASYSSDTVCTLCVIRPRAEEVIEIYMSSRSLEAARLRATPRRARSRGLPLQPQRRRAPLAARRRTLCALCKVAALARASDGRARGGSLSSCASRWHVLWARVRRRVWRQAARAGARALKAGACCALPPSFRAPAPRRAARRRPPASRHACAATCLLSLRQRRCAFLSSTWARGPWLCVVPRAAVATARAGAASLRCGRAKAASCGAGR